MCGVDGLSVLTVTRALTLRRVKSLATVVGSRCRKVNKARRRRAPSLKRYAVSYCLFVSGASSRFD